MSQVDVRYVTAAVCASAAYIFWRQRVHLKLIEQELKQELKQHARSQRQLQEFNASRSRGALASDGEIPVHAIVTGVLGGIGSATAKVLVAAGYHVIGLDRRELKHGVECEATTFIQCDIKRYAVGAVGNAAVNAHIREVMGGHGLKLLVNNAAHQVVKPLEETSLEDWDEVMSTNVGAAFSLVKEFLPELKSARGSVCNIASIHANLTKPGFVAYATSKGALVSLTRALAVELGPFGIRANALLPAATRTPMLLAGFEGKTQEYASLEDHHPSGRLCEPWEVAEFVAFIASDRAGNISGSSLQVPPPSAPHFVASSVRLPPHSVRLPPHLTVMICVF